MIDLKRRFFIFGATAAALIVPPARTFHILSPPKLIKPTVQLIPAGELFDLPHSQAHQMVQKLLQGRYALADIPRWVVLDQAWYDRMIREEAKGGLVNYTRRSDDGQHEEDRGDRYQSRTGRAARDLAAGAELDRDDRLLRSRRSVG